MDPGRSRRRGPLSLTAALALACGALAIVGSAGPASPARADTRTYVHMCSAPASGSVACMATVPQDVDSGTPKTCGPPK